MQTCLSPRTVMGVAYHLARRLLPDHACKFSRHDFTLAQLFACLVVREIFGLSFRRAEALLADSPAWLADIGLRKAPDHNTLWRAFEALLATRRCTRMLDLLAELFAQARLLTVRRAHQPLAIDSTCYESHHRSRHYDRRCRRMAAQGRGPGKYGKTVNAARSQRLRATPKLSIAVNSGCHLILAAKVRRGNCSDAPDFDGDGNGDAARLKPRPRFMAVSIARKSERRDAASLRCLRGRERLTRFGGQSRG